MQSDSSIKNKPVGALEKKVKLKLWTQGKENLTKKGSLMGGQ